MPVSAGEERLATPSAAQQLAVAQQSLAAMERFIYICSHDLREPLRMITGFLGLLERRSAGLNPQQLDYLGLALGGAKRLDGMLEALLAYSRCGRTRSPKICDSSEAATEVLAKVRSENPTVDIACTVIKLPQVWADPLQLFELLYQLLSNAVRFRHGDSAQITLSAEETPGRTTLLVADRGIGVAPADQQRVFEVFQRLHPQDRYPGIGMGLPICLRIMEQHQGEIGFREPPAGVSTIIACSFPALASRRE
jgi:light-regulated signal transduction histidine kinase (bacteriophytochrome)